MGQQHTPFRRATAMFEAIATILASTPNPSERQRALGELDPYRSRGKGRGSFNFRFSNKDGKYRPHQGKREMARRVRQMNRYNTEST